VRDPDLTISADGDDPEAEISTTLGAIDYDDSRIAEIEVRLRFEDEADTKPIPQPTTSVGGEGEGDDEEETLVRTLDPTLDVAVEKVGDGWLRVLGDSGHLQRKTNQHAALAVIAGATEDGGSCTANDVANMIENVDESAASALVTPVYKRGLIDRHPGGNGNAFQYEYRVNSDGLAELDRLAPDSDQSP
jgi:hypothetical protein